MEPLRPQRVSGSMPRVFSVHPPLPRGMEVMAQQYSHQTSISATIHTNLLILVHMCAGDGREWDDMGHAARGLPPYFVHYTSRICVWKSQRRRRGAGAPAACCCNASASLRPQPTASLRPCASYVLKWALGWSRCFHDCSGAPPSSAFTKRMHQLLYLPHTLRLRHRCRHRHRHRHIYTHPPP